MGFLDDAQTMFDRGVSAAKGAVSGVAVEQQAFAKGFARLAADGCAQGWHEGNGGNLSYRLAPEEVASCRSFFYDNPSSWVPMGVRADNLRGEFFLVTASGSHLRNVALDLDANAGIVEVGPAGDAWRIVWGFKDGRMPTSEMAAHALAQSARKEATAGRSRVMYHAHPAYTVALTNVVPLDARTFTRTLWKAMLEAMVAFPSGVGVVPWTVPGGSAIAEATAEVLRDHAVCVWAHHGLMCAGATFDEAFGLAQAVEKAACVHRARPHDERRRRPLRQHHPRRGPARHRRGVRPCRERGVPVGRVARLQLRCCADRRRRQAWTTAGEGGRGR